MNACQGASWSGKLDGKELHGAVCDLEPRGSPFLEHRRPEVNLPFAIYKCGMIISGVMFG